MTGEEAKQLKHGDCVMIGEGESAFKGRVVCQRIGAVEIHWIGVSGSSGYVAWDDARTWMEIEKIELEELEGANK